MQSDPLSLSMTHGLSPKSFFLLGLLLAMPACGEQASPAFDGQPLATIQGTLTVHRTGALPDADIVIAWPDVTQGTATETSVYTSVRQPVSSKLPAGFRLDLVEPPPPTAFAPLPAGWSGPRSTLGQILIVKSGATPARIDSTDPAIIQVVQDYLISYVDGTGELTGPADSGGNSPRIPLTKGFTLTRQKIAFCSSAVDSGCASTYGGQLSKTGVDWVCGTTRDEQTRASNIPFSTSISIDITDSGAPWVPADLTETCPLSPPA